MTNLDATTIQKFNTQFLKEQHDLHANTPCELLFENIKQIITRANLTGRTHTRVSIKAHQRWESTLKYFEDLGFRVTSYGNDHEKDFDDDGDEVYLFDIYWGTD